MIDKEDNKSFKFRLTIVHIDRINYSRDHTSKINTIIIGYYLTAWEGQPISDINRRRL